MNEKIKNLVAGICTLGEIGCIIGLAVVGLKRNNDCYKAECKLIDTELELGLTKLDNTIKDCEIKCLRKENERLKARYEVEEES